MAGPWEDYAPPAAEVSAPPQPQQPQGPWRDFDQPPAKVAEQPTLLSDIGDVFMGGVHTIAHAPAQITSAESPTFDGLGTQIEKKMLAAGHAPDEAKRSAADLVAKLGRNDGFAGLVTGPLQMVFAPIQGAIRQYFSRPIEEDTGFPKEVTEGLINVGLSFFVLKGPKQPPQIKPYVRPEPIAPVEGSPNPGLSRVEAAKTGLPEIDAVLESPVTRKAIDGAVIDRSHDVPYTAGGSVPLDDPTVFIDRRFPKQFTVRSLSDPARGVTFDPAEPFAIHENVEQHVMDMLIKGGMKPEEAYRVAHFEYAERAEGAWYAAHDIDQAAAEAAYAPHMTEIQKGPADNVPPNLYTRPYPHDHPSAAAGEALAEAKPTPEEVAQARAIVGKHIDELQDKPAGPDLDQAAELGVIGGGENGGAKPPAPPKPPGPSGGAPGEPLNPWQARWQHFTGKLDAPADVIQTIRDAATENGDFLPARQGKIRLSEGQIEDIANAAGVNADEVNAAGIGRRLQNDAQVRVAMQLMRDLATNLTETARDARADPSPANLIKLQEAIMRRDMAVEQVVGLRAEWGRTGNVIQEFLRDVKDQEGLSAFLKGKGRSAKDLKDIADTVAGLNSDEAVARLMNDLRTPTAWDKLMYYWVNALISGPTTHTKYVLANASFAGYESAVVTPIAGVIGTARRAISGSHEGVYIGEAGARLWGIVAGVPDAIVGAARAARTGLQTPLPGEIAQNIVPRKQRTINFQQKPIEGILGTAIGIPSHGASAIHSFFNFLGYRASIEAQAYRTAAKEGLRPVDDAFWQRRSSRASQPTIEMMNEAIEEGYRLTYINELSPVAKKITQAVKATKVGQLLLPFMHIPFNILARGLEGTPLAVLPAETRAALSGKSGAVKQDMAIARLVAGSAVGAWAVNLVANDRMTGWGPTDPKERSQWLATGHQPYSIRIGSYWYSFNRFGSLGTMLGLHANLAEAIPHIKPDSEELAKALTMTVHASGRLLEDEVGMQGLAGLIEAISEPERKGTRFVSSFVGSFLPYSSLLRQTASAMDPSMREAKSLTDGLRYYIPVVRSGLLPKRDWTGTPIANAGYGGDIPYAPGASAVIQHRAVSTDPVNWEMKTLDMHPAPPSNRIGGVKLPAGLYDQYQTLAGPMTRHALESLVNMPGWYELPPVAREMAFRQAIQATRAAAAASLQAAHPEIITQGIKNRLDHINGVKPTKLQEP